MANKLLTLKNNCRWNLSISLSGFSVCTCLYNVISGTCFPRLWIFLFFKPYDRSVYWLWKCLFGGTAGDWWVGLSLQQQFGTAAGQQQGLQGWDLGDWEVNRTRQNPFPFSVSRVNKSQFSHSPKFLELSVCHFLFIYYFYYLISK